MIIQGQTPTHVNGFAQPRMAAPSFVIAGQAPAHVPGFAQPQAIIAGQAPTHVPGFAQPWHIEFPVAGTGSVVDAAAGTGSLA